jgi:sugar phosphate isomerase/epimerase
MTDRLVEVSLPDDPGAFVPAVTRAAALGFTHVEVAALAERPTEHLEALADSGLVVACARLSGDLSAADVAVRCEALRRLKLQVADAARLGATLARLDVPEGGPHVEEALALLAEYAAARMVRLVTEPALPGVDVVALHSPHTSSRTSSAT